MFLLSFLTRNKNLIIGILLVAAVVGFGYGMFKFGESSKEAEVVIEEKVIIQETIRNVETGRQTFRNANPTGDAAISLQRLRARQDSKRQP